MVHRQSLRIKGKFARQPTENLSVLPKRTFFGKTGNFFWLSEIVFPKSVVNFPFRAEFTVYHILSEWKGLCAAIPQTVTNWMFLRAFWCC